MAGNYAIIRTAKIKNTANLLQSAMHNTREHKKTPNAKPELKHLNTVEFGVKTAKEVVEEVSQRLAKVEKESGRKNRKDAVIAQQYLLNASPEFFKTLSPTAEKEWIRKNIEFMKDKYGEENLIQVIAHRDESHLHLQAFVVPVVRDDTGTKLSANAYTGTKALLRQLQTDYAGAMKKFGLKRGRGYNIEMDYKELNEYKEEYEEKLAKAKEEAGKVKYNVLNYPKVIEQTAEEKTLLQEELKRNLKHTQYLEKKLEKLERVIELVTEGKITPKQIRNAQINEQTMGGKEYDSFIDKIIDKSEQQKAPFPEKKPQLETFEEIIEKTESQNMRKFEQEIIDGIKRIPIQYYLEEVANAEPGKKQGNETYYKSPFRAEKTASFAVNEQTNTWYDFGEKKGGDIIKLDMELYQRSFVESVEFLSGATARGLTLSPTPPESEEQDFKLEDTEKKKIEIESVKEIQNKALLRLVESRSIKKDVAVQKLREVAYKSGEKHLYGLGMECDNGTYATFNKYGKFRTGESDITTIPLKGSKNTVIFEGMTDYLARLSEVHPRQLDANVIIMHGAGNTDKAIKKIKEIGAKNVYLYKHNDKAGELVLATMKEELKEAFKITDMSEKYRDFNDYNEKTMWEAEQKIEKEIRKNKGLELS